MINTVVLQRAIEEFVTVDQAAQLAGCHAATVRRAVDRGDIEGFKTAAWGRMILRRSAETWARARAGRADVAA